MHMLTEHYSLSPLQVLVISHIPPGDMGNHAAYGEFYLNMTKQFSDTIVGHLFGHTHMDQFQLVGYVAMTTSLFYKLDTPSYVA